MWPHRVSRRRNGNIKLQPCYFLDLEVWQAELVFSVYRGPTFTLYLLVPALTLGTCPPERPHLGSPTLGTWLGSAHRGYWQAMERKKRRTYSSFSFSFFLGFFFFFFFFFGFLEPHPRHVGIPRLGVESELQLPSWQQQIRAMSVTYITAHGNAGSLTQSEARD